MKRFVTEYANWLKARYKKGTKRFIDDEILLTDWIDDLVHSLYRGNITVSECMRALAEADYDVYWNNYQLY